MKEYVLVFDKTHTSTLVCDRLNKSEKEIKRRTRITTLVFTRSAWPQLDPWWVSNLRSTWTNDWSCSRTISSVEPTPTDPTIRTLNGSTLFPLPEVPHLLPPALDFHGCRTLKSRTSTNSWGTRCNRRDSRLRVWDRLQRLQRRRRLWRLWSRCLSLSRSTSFNAFHLPVQVPVVIDWNFPAFCEQEISRSRTSKMLPTVNAWNTVVVERETERLTWTCWPSCQTTWDVFMHTTVRTIHLKLESALA